MGIVTDRIKHKWQAMSLEEKVSAVIDFVCGFGMSAVCGGIGSRYTQNRGIPTRICAAFGMSGLGMAAGKVASEALMDNLGKPVCDIVNRAKEKKEGQKHE